MDFMEIVSVPVITTIVYAALALYKYAVNGKESLIRLIPVFAVLLGVILGIVAFYAVNEIIPADNVLTAILIGGASGLAATGTNQIFKQLNKDNKKEEGPDENSTDANGK